MDPNQGQPPSPLTPDVDPDARAHPVEPGAPTPNLERTGAAVAAPATRSAGVTVLAVLAVLYTLYFAQGFLIPIAYALLLSFLFGPLVRLLARYHIRPPLGAGLIIMGLLGVGGLAAYELSGPVQSWATSAPETLATAQQRLRKLARPLERVTRTAEQVERATAGVSGPKAPAQVVVQEPTLVSRLFGTTRRLLSGIGETLILLYFLLAGGDLFLQKLIKVLPSVGNRRKAVEIARRTEASISTYLLTTAAVNVAEGAVVAGAMWLLGMPNPLLWGALVALLEFIPYLGAITMTVILSLAALTTFDTVGQALLVPAAFLAINLVQANMVAPLLLGHRLALNPVALFVGLAFWFWIWGIAGAFIAVPLLATLKIFCDHIGGLAAFGEFLGPREEGERRAILR